MADDETQRSGVECLGEIQAPDFLLPLFSSHRKEVKADHCTPWIMSDTTHGRYTLNLQSYHVHVWVQTDQGTDLSQDQDVAIPANGRLWEEIHLYSHASIRVGEIDAVNCRRSITMIVSSCCIASLVWNQR